MRIYNDIFVRYKRSRGKCEIIGEQRRIEQDGKWLRIERIVQRLPLSIIFRDCVESFLRRNRICGEDKARK